MSKNQGSHEAPGREGTADTWISGGGAEPSSDIKLECSGQIRILDLI